MKRKPKRRKQLLCVIAYLTRAEAGWRRSIDEFWMDPMTEARGRADELAEDLSRQMRIRVLREVRLLSGNNGPFVTLLELERYGWKGRQYEFLDDVTFHRL